VTAPAPVTVVGLGAGELPALARERLARAELVAGGARQLDAHAPPGARRARLAADLAPALDEIAAGVGPSVVLASGDPGFFGIVRALAERVGPERLEVLPAPSSVSLAFARIGVPWDDALVVSAHGRAPAAAVNAARAHPKVAVLTAPGFGPAELARELTGLDRLLVVAERLGEPDERVVRGGPDEVAAGAWDDPNVVLVLDSSALVGPKGRGWPPSAPHGWALPDEAFEHRGGMITKAEVRALVLARLGPGVGDLVWDVGTGSGAVGVECARLGAAVVALDRDPEECARARRNAERHGARVDVRRGEAPAALHELPDPDAVFVGGAGEALLDVVEVAAARAGRAVVVALATIERVVPAGERLAALGWEVETTMLHAARGQGIAGLHRLAGTNPVFVVAGARA
jgi:precorrin-6Y C5,15-methyltransferase (decarboxylating)